MKNIFKIPIIALIAMLSWACESDDDQAVAQAVTAPKLVTPNTDVILDQALEDNPALTIVWDHANYDVATSINYTIEIAKAATDFEAPITAGITTDRFFAWTVGELNNNAILAGLEGGTEGSLEIRVTSSLGTEDFGEQTSNVLIVTTTPYSTVIPLTHLFLVGNGTAAGWNPDNNNQAIIRNPDNDNEFSFTGRIGGEGTLYKFLTSNQWAPQYGSDGGTGLAFRPTDGDPDPAPLDSGADGYYTVNLNIEDLTINIANFDESGATDYGSIGLIGDSTPDGWDSDQDLTQSTFDPHVWYIKGIQLNDGGAKFRVDDAWDTNWGGPNFPSGPAEFNSSSNIPVAAGIYDVWFYDLDASYIFIPVQ